MLDHLLRGRLAERRVVGKRALALDQPARHVAGDRVHHLRHFVGLRQHRAAVAGVLHETVLPLVAAHLDMGDDVDPQPRHVAFAHAAVEQFDVLGDVLEHRIERLVEQFEPRHLGVAQVDHHGRALGRLDARLAHGVLERIGRLRRCRLGFLATSPHAAQFSNARGRRKAEK